MASKIVRFNLKSLLLPKEIYVPYFNVVKYSSLPLKKKSKRGTIKHRNVIESSCESLAARGFLRSLKPYTPEKNVTEKIIAICEKVLKNKYEVDSPLTREDKFLLLNNCFEELGHSVPNSLLHKIVNVKEVINFYNTPISTTNPYDALQKQDLPPNLHVIPNYVRFDPDTDTKFKGISAFPRSPTIVSGLKFKEKYKGVIKKSPYLDTEVVFDKDDPF